MRQVLTQKVVDAIGVLYPDAQSESIIVDTSDDRGDLISNAALVVAGQTKESPRDVGRKIAARVCEEDLPGVSRVEVASTGFIHFFLDHPQYAPVVQRILQQRHGYGTSREMEGERVMIEYTDPNPFKPMHIGYAVPSVMGEALARLYEQCGADVKRVNYQGDIGLHVAKVVWGMQHVEDEVPRESDPLTKKMTFLRRSYRKGEEAYFANNTLTMEILRLERDIYRQSNHNVNRYYDMGRRWSLDYFETIYRKLGINFDFYFFESETGAIGARIVEEGIERGVFVESEGVYIFRGDTYGLQNRVFINSAGLPTYEAKELGVAQLKFDTYKHTRSLVIAGVAVSEYFKVVHKVMELIMPDIAKMTQHVPNGAIKHVSHQKTKESPVETGAPVRLEDFIGDISDIVREKMKNRKNLSEVEKRGIELVVAVGAIKFSILRQHTGKDIVFDDESALSFEKDSGPYIQHTYAHIQSLLKNNPSPVVGTDKKDDAPAENVERLLTQYPNIVKRALYAHDLSHVCEYVLKLADAFNAYEVEKNIAEVDGGDIEEPYRALAEAVAQVLRNGLYILGIDAPDKM